MEGLKGMNSGDNSALEKMLRDLEGQMKILISDLNRLIDETGRNL